MPNPTRKLQPVGIANVKLSAGFWAQRQDTNRRVTIPYELEQCKATGRIHAFKLDYQPGQPDPPHIFWDSDVAKWVEAACYCLTTHPDPELRQMIDEVVDLIVGAQQPDGYLNCHYTVVEPDKRWTNLRDRHELYCAGHLMEAAVAHFNATGDRKLLNALCRYADYIDSVFGPGKRTGYPGHEEIELALVKLYHATGQDRYLKLSQYFSDERGKQPHFFDEEARARGEDPGPWACGKHCLHQAHLPVREQDEALGHSVRAMYLYSGMADIAADTGDDALFAACERIWQSAAERKMYLTGGVGSSRQGEKFTADYDLPNESAYAETCAAIGLVLFAHRMLQLTGHGRYADVMERALYNGVASGLSLSGDRFFYENPLASAGGHHRQPWFGCACCPPNIARMIASVGGYVAATTGNALYVHLYASSEIRADIAGQDVTLEQKTRYPWRGKVRLTLRLDKAAKFALMLRVPGWCGKFKIKVNGKAVDAKVDNGYAAIERKWKDGDKVRLSLSMPVQRIAAHPKVEADAGRVALQRGPIVFCLEQCDNDADVRTIVLPDKGKLKAKFDPDLLGGAVVIQGQAAAPQACAGRLYQPLCAHKLKQTRIRAVPYCLWDNREPGAMAVWLVRET